MSGTYVDSMGKRRKHPFIKIMLDGAYNRHGTREWCVAAGDVPKRNRGCEWRALAFFATADSALRYYDKLDPKLGRAMFDLVNDRLKFVSPDGRLRRCAEIENQLMS